MFDSEYVTISEEEIVSLGEKYLSSAGSRDQELIQLDKHSNKLGHHWTTELRQLRGIEESGHEHGGCGGGVDGGYIHQMFCWLLLVERSECMRLVLAMCLYLRRNARLTGMIEYSHLPPPRPLIGPRPPLPAS